MTIDKLLHNDIVEFGNGESFNVIKSKLFLILSNRAGCFHIPKYDEDDSRTGYNDTLEYIGRSGFWAKVDHNLSINYVYREEYKNKSFEVKKVWSRYRDSLTKDKLTNGTMITLANTKEYIVVLNSFHGPIIKPKYKDSGDRIYKLDHYTHDLKYVINRSALLHEEKYNGDLRIVDAIIQI